MLELIGASLIWSVSFGLIGNLLAGLSPAWVAMVRLAVAAAVFLPFAKRVPPAAAGALALIGAVQFGAMSLAYMCSFRYLKSHEVALFTVMTPVYVSVLNDLVSRRFHGANLAAAALAVGGAALVLWKGVSSPKPLVGFLLVETSNLCFAAGQLAYREWFRRAGLCLGDHQAFFWLYLGGLAALAPLVLSAAPDTAPHPSATQLGALLYLGVFVSGLGYFLWNRGARRVATGPLAVMNNLKIPLGVAVSLAVFGERTHLPTLVAGALLVAAALIPAFRAAGRGEA